MDIILMSRIWGSFTSPWRVWIQESPRYKKWSPRWWLNQPIWKNVLIKLDHFPTNRGANKKKNMWKTDHLVAFQHQSLVVASIHSSHSERRFWNKTLRLERITWIPYQQGNLCSRWFFWLSWWCDMWVTSLEGVYSYQILSRLEKKTFGATKVPFRSEKPLNLTIDPGGNKETSTWKSNLQYLKAQLLPSPKIPPRWCRITWARLRKKHLRDLNKKTWEGHWVIYSRWIYHMCGLY